MDTTSAPSLARILRVQLHIQGHLHRKLSLTALAQVAGLSPYHFHRLFRSSTGETVYAYVRRLRLERAALDLRYSSDSVVEIAAGVGYRSPEAFCRAFRARFAASPSRFRAEHAPASCIGPRQGPPIRVIEGGRYASYRALGPYEDVGPILQRVADVARRHGGALGEGDLLGVVHDDPTITAGAQVRFDAAVRWPGPPIPGHQLRFEDRRSLVCAVAIHEGPYAGLGMAFEALFARIAISGQRCSTQPPFQRYLQHPPLPPSAWRTELCVPLRSPV